MDDAAFEAERARLKPIVDLYVGLLERRGWWITVHFMRRPALTEDRASAYQGVPWATLMECSAQWHYAKASLTIYCPATAEHEDLADVETFFAHECGHVLVCELRPEEGPSEDFRQHEERVAEMIGRMLTEVHRRGVEEGVASVEQRRDAEARQ